MDDEQTYQRFIDPGASPAQGRGGRLMEPGQKVVFETFVFACNALRSARKAAEGFVSGKRLYALRSAEANHRCALLALEAWCEDKVREELKLPPTPGRYIEPIHDL